MKLKLRYQKRTDYGDDVFICTDDKERPIEKEGFEKLKDIAGQLEKRFNTFLPIYYSSDYEYCSVRFKPCGKKFKIGHVYEVKFNVKQITKKDNVYCNCFITSTKFIKSQKIEEDELILFE